MLRSLALALPAPHVSAHCDGPCGVYDPASARIAAEAVLSMTKKLLDAGPATTLAEQNTQSRYIAIKEEQAHQDRTARALDRLLQAASPRGLPRPPHHLLERGEVVSCAPT